MVHSVGLLDRSPVKTVVDLPGSVTLPYPPVPCSQTPPESPAPSPLAGAYWCLPSFRPCRPPVHRITRLNRFTCVTARTSLGLRLAHVVTSTSPRLDSRWGGSFPLPGRELHPLEAPGLAWRTEIRSQVEIDDVGLAPDDCLRHALDRRVRGLLRAVAIRPRLEVGFEDRFQDEFQRPLHHAIANGRNREVTNLAPLFRYSDLPRSLGPIPPLHQLLAQLVKKRLHAICFDGLERHPITAGGAVVLFGQLVGSAARVPFADVTIQAPKSPRWFGLRRDAQSSSQVLQLAGRVYQSTPAFGIDSDIDAARLLGSTGVTPLRRCRVGGGASHDAGLRPPLKLHVQFSRMQLSRKRGGTPRGQRRDQANQAHQPQLAAQTPNGEGLPPRTAPSPESMRPQASFDPTIELVEESPYVGALIVLTPSANHRIEFANQLRRRMRDATLIRELNPVIRGWGEYYKRAHVRRLFNQ